MSRLLILGDPVVTLGDEAWIPDGALIVEDQRIVTAGPREQLESAGPFERVLGSPGHFVMPGWVNCHYHTDSAAGPGLFDTVFEINNVQMNAGSGSGSEEDVYTVTLYALMNAIKGGQTACVNMFYGRPDYEFFGADAALRAFDEIGFRGAFGLVSRDQNRYVHEDDGRFLSRLPGDLAAEVRASGMGYAWPVDAVFDAFRSLAERWQDHDDRLRVIVAPDWTPSCSDDLYRRSRALADEYVTGITSHVLETRAEMMYSLSAHGEPAVKRLQRLGVLGPDFTAAHFVWVSDEEIGVFADSGAVASNDPGSNLRLCTGIARVRDVMDAGGRVAFGTDNISFSDTEDFFQEVRLACYLQRTPHQIDQGRLDSERVLRAAAENGARALGFEGRLGSLRPGQFADLLVLRRDRVFAPDGRYANTPVLDVILDRADASDIANVLIHGRVVLEHGRLTTVDEDRVMRQLGDAAARLYHKSPEGERLWQLGGLLVPTVQDFYRPWYETPTQPAHQYNVAAAPSPTPPPAPPDLGSA